MKIKQLIIVAFISCISMSFTPNNGTVDTKTLLLKTWALSDIDASKLMGMIAAENQAAFKKKFSELLAKSKNKTTLTFAKDGTFKSYSMGADGQWSTATGKWSVSKDNKKLTMTIKGQDGVADINELSAQKLTLNMQGLIMKYVAKK